MNLIGRGIQALRGARKLELFLMIILIAVAIMLITGNSDNIAAENSMELRLQNVLECMEGVGSVKVAINNDAEGKALGVLVVAEGAENIGTYLAIQQAVRTFVGIDISGIEIIEMEGR